MVIGWEWSGFRADGYNLVLWIHIACAIIGFGAVMLNGIYGRESQARPGPEGLAIAQANYKVSSIGEYFIWVVGLSGIALVLMSDEVWKFSQTWVTVALTLYILGIVLAQGILFPTARKMNALMVELVEMGPPPEGAPAGAPPPQVTQLEALGKRMGIVSTVLHLMLAAILVTMIWKPWL